MITRRDVALMAASLLVGPPVGAAVFLLATASWGLVGGDGARNGAAAVWGVLPLLLVASYTFGAIPAAIAGVANAVLSRRVSSSGLRILWAAPIGIAATLVSMGWLAVQPGHGTVPAPVFLIVLCAVGAAASIASVAVTEAISATRLRVR